VSWRLLGLRVELDERCDPHGNVFAESVRVMALRRAEQVERAILDGADEVVSGNVHWILPKWREHPINRARIAVARRRHRRTA
jgi:uncharacterized UPF0146 family protein